MIMFTRDNEKVVCHVGTTLPHDCEGKHNSVFPFCWETQYPYAAELLLVHLQEALDVRLRAIRREAYAAGRKDAKAKTRQKTEFSDAWDADYVGF